MSHGHITFNLFARPSFYEGMGRLLDLGSTLQSYNESDTANEADAIATMMDWLATGDDLRSAMTAYETEKSRLG